MGVSPRVVLQTTQEQMHKADALGVYGGGEKALLDVLSQFFSVVPQSLALTHNVTEGTNIILSGLPLNKHDEIVCTDHEHAGTAIPLLIKAQQSGAKLKVAAIDTNPEKTTQNILNAISSKTKLVCIPHMPCTIGQVLEVQNLAQACRQRGVLSLIDGAHPPGMIQVNLSELGCDFYTGCGHKWMLGPKGTGFLYVNPSVLNRLNLSFTGAGTHNAYTLNTSTQELPLPAEGARRFYFGSQNAGLYLGLASAAEFLLHAVGMEYVEKHTRYLALWARNQIQKHIPGAHFFCPDDPQFRAGVTAFSIQGIDSQKLCSYLRSKNIIVRHVHENQLNVVRVSTHIYNNEEDIERLISEIKAFIKA